MPRNLRPNAPATITDIKPVTDVSGNLTAYNVTVSVGYIDDQANPISTIVETIDAWPLLGAAMKTQLQNIQNAFMAGINSKYFG